MRSLYVRSLVLGAVSIFLSSCPLIAADTRSVSASPEITLNEAVRLALESNPTLAAQRFRLTEASAQRDQAALRPPIVLGADVENILGTGRIGALDSLEATLRLSTVIEMGSKRSLRITAAERSLETADTRRDVETLDVLSAVASRFITNLAAQEKRKIAQEHVERAQQILADVKQRTRAGLGSPVEEGNAAVHLTELEIALAAAESNLRRSWALLASTWNAPPDGSGLASGDLYTLPPLNSFAQLAEKIERNPHMTKFAAERAAAEARARTVRAGRTPDITVSAGIRRLEAQRDQALVLGLSIPLGSAGRNKPLEDVAAAQASHAAAMEVIAKNESMANVYVLYEQAAQSRLAVIALQEAALPVALKTLDRAQEGYRAGRFSLYEVSAAQEHLHEIEESTVDAAERYHLAIAEIERLTSEPVEVQPAMDKGAKP